MTLKHRNFVICLGGGVEGLPIIQRVRELGFVPIIVDGKWDCPGAAWVRGRVVEKKQIHTKSTKPHVSNEMVIADDAMFVHGNCYGVRGTIESLTRLHHYVFPSGYKGEEGSFKRSGIVGVLCCAVDAPHVQAEVAEWAGAPTIGRLAAATGVNKYDQWKALSDHGLPVPPTRIVSPETDPNTVGTLNIVKPIDSRGARGVIRFDPATFREACIEALSNSPSKMVIAQKWIRGDQLSTESIIARGRVVHTSVALRNYGRLKETYPYVIEDGSDCPYPLTNHLLEQLNALLEHACAALKWDNLTVKGDIILDHDVFYIIELAPRLSGGYFCSHITPLAYDVDFLRHAIGLCAGTMARAKYALRYGTPRFVSQRYVFPLPDQIGQRILSLPSPESNADIALFTWNKQVWDIISQPKCHPDRLGQVIALGDTQARANETAEKVVATMAHRLQVGNPTGAAPTRQQLIQAWRDRLTSGS